MRNYRRIRFLLLAFLLLSMAAPCFGQKSKSELEKEKQQIELQIKKLNAELASAKKNTRSSTEQLNVLNRKIAERTRLINNINSQMTLINSKITSLQDSMSILQIRIDSLKSEYGKIIRVLYAERTSMGAESYIFDAENFNRAFLRRKYFQEYSRYRKMQAATIRDRESELRGINLSLEQQKRQKNDLLSQQQKQKAELAREQSQQQQQVKKSQNREKELKNQLSKKEKERQKLQQQIQKIINEEIAKARRAAEAERKAAAAKKTSKGNTGGNANTSKPVPSASDAASTTFASSKGKLSWPVYYKSVAREYGRYTHESGGENMNNGIDLITASGAEVMAVYEGKVTRIFTCPNGTKGVIVRHGEYMSVYANLGSVAVSEGKTVKMRQKIGTVQNGSDGTAEFSFQLWKGTESQNPRKWLR